jgi:imidazolonepropionase-like amidohydrolase
MSLKDSISKMTRRQLIQATIASALSLSFPGIGGCSAAPPRCSRVPADEDRPLALINGHVVDVTSGVIHRHKILIVHRGIIEALTDQMPEPGNGFAVIDLQNQYVIPGLIDAHCHSTLTSQATLNLSGLPTLLRQFKRNYLQQLAHGVTTIRDMGAMPKMLQNGLEMIAKGDIPGPRVVYCNAFTNIQGGHPDIAPQDISVFSGIIMSFTGNSNLWFQNIPDLKTKMAQNIAGGASFIKLTMDKKSLLCGRGDIPFYSDEHLRVIMDFAQKHSLPTAAHIHTRFGFDRALQYGVSSMEHSVADAEITDREALLMAQKKIAITPTLIIAQMLAAEEAYAQPPPSYRTDFIANEMAIRRKYLNSVLDDDIEPDIHQANTASLQNYQKYGCEQLYAKGKFHARPDLYFDILLRGPENLLKMKQAGVLIGCGTDSGVPLIYHGTLWREMEMFRRIGFTPEDVLRCATINNAMILGMADQIGSIEEGKFADMVVLKENPLEKIEACRTPHMVIKEGRIYDVSKQA